MLGPPPPPLPGSHPKFQTYIDTIVVTPCVGSRDVGENAHSRENQRTESEDYTFRISLNVALRDRGDAARTVILAELKQMMDTQVWHGVLVSCLSMEERDKIIRCSVFHKDKFNVSDEYDKLNARIVADGEQQDKKLYEDLCFYSPTTSITSVLAVTDLVACESISVTVIDIEGAFLNAGTTSTGIKASTRLSHVVTDLLVHMEPKHVRLVEERGTSVAMLAKALYGRVKAVDLWHAILCATMRGDRFVPNPRISHAC